MKDDCGKEFNSRAEMLAYQLGKTGEPVDTKVYEAMSRDEQWQYSLGRIDADISRVGKAAYEQAMERKLDWLESKGYR